MFLQARKSKEYNYSSIYNSNGELVVLHDASDTAFEHTIQSLC